MEFSELVKRRYSVRSYNGKKVEQEKVEKILEAAHAAPTAANLQPVRLLVIRQEEGLKKLAKAANIYHAPLAIVVCADHSKAWVRPFDKKQTCDIDASILTDHMMLQAADLGLGSVWICYFKPDVLREEFCIPENLELVNILAVGYSDEMPPSPDRHEQTRITIKELASFEHFSDRGEL